MAKKFALTDVWYPQNLSLTEARKILGRAAFDRLGKGHSYKFMGIGNPYNFTVTRIQ